MRRTTLLLALLATGCHRKAAEAPIDRASPTLPADAAQLYAQGKLALDDKKFDAAIADFTRATAVATDPDLRANAWLALGATYDEKDDHAHAVAAFEQVTVLRPDDADAWRVLADGLDRAGKRERRAAALEHVVAIDPNDLGAYLDLAGLDATIGKADAAKDVYVRYEARRGDALRALGTAKDGKARADAAEMLGGARDAATARALVLALTDKDASVRLACARALGDIGLDVDKNVRDAVAAARAKEHDEKVRAALDEDLASK